MTQPEDSRESIGPQEPKKPRGLWAMMNQTEAEPETAESPPQEEQQETEQPAEETSAATDLPNEDTKSPRSLWQMMGGSSPSVEAETPTQETPAETGGKTPALPDAPKTKGLWAVMGQPATAEPETTEPEPAAPSSAESVSEPTAVPPEKTAKKSGAKSPDKTPPADPVEPVAAVSREEVLGADAEPLPVPETTTTRSSRLADEKRSRLAWWSLVLGTLSIPLSGLSMMPEFWAKLPAMALSFPALWLGFAALGELRRSRTKTTPRIVAGLGILTSVAGMFLGPMVFADLGEGIRLESGRRVTRSRLQHLGSGLVKFHDNRGRFPMGGRFEGDRPMHGWMTELLPFIGENQLFNQVDLNVPWDDARNRPAMSQQVTAFQASGAVVTKVGDAYGLTHFSGLGGQELDDVRGLSEVGIFGRNQTVNRNDVVDGLSQTLVAGEIARAFPAWGDPENWRTIGKGLNKDYRGFGNADRTGCMFLHADGSVKFYSNSVSAELLIQLSTRDGREEIDTSFGK